MVVPFAWFTFVPVAPDALTVSLVNTEYRYSVNPTLPLRSAILNPFPLEAITVRLLDVDAEEILLDKLGAESQDDGQDDDGIP